MFDVSSEDITEGSLGRALAVLATPLVLQHFVIVGQQIIDVFWVGRLGPDAVAAIGMVQPVLGLMFVGSYVATTGGQVTISQRIGTGDVAGGRRATTHALVLVGLVNLLLAVVVFLTADTITGALTGDRAVATLAAAYISLMGFAAVFQGLSDVVEASYLGWGESRIPMALNVLAVLLNLVLDPLLIFDWTPLPGFGIAGAALATMIAFLVSFGIGFITLVTDVTAFTLTRSSFTPDAETVRRVLGIGTPKALQEIGRQLARLVIVLIISVTGGAAGLAAYTVGARVATVAFVPAQAIGSAATTLVGQNLGADHPDRAYSATWLGVRAGAILLGFIGVLQWFVPELLANVFVPGISGQALSFTIAYLRILALGYWALGTIWTVEAGFNGAGHTEISMYSTLLQYWAVRVPIAAVGAFVLGFGALGAYWAVTLSNIVAAVGLTAFFVHSTRRGMLQRASEKLTPGTAD